MKMKKKCEMEDNDSKAHEAGEKKKEAMGSLLSALKGSKSGQVKGPRMTRSK